MRHMTGARTSGKIWDQEAANTHDSMQVPTSATGHEEEAQAAATGHEEARANTTVQEKKC